MKKLILILLVLPTVSFAQVRTASIFSDNMVFQREHPVHIWGKAKPGRKVQVEFNGNSIAVITRPDSSWNVIFGPQKANTRPTSIIVYSGKQRIELKNILLGDVWVCIGQSNMEFPMNGETHFRQEISSTSQPLLRFYNPSYIGKNVYATLYSDSMIQRLNVRDFYNGKWQRSDSNSVKSMSAVAYYFGKQIIQSTGIPVGLIHLAIGGCPLESFVNPKQLVNSKRFFGKVQGNWLLNELMPVWARMRGAQNLGRNESNDTNPNHAYKPGFAYETGISPILPFPVKGIIMYQGESNAQEIDRVREYSELMKLMVDDYRKGWRQATMPFYFVQLSSIDTVKYKGHLWPQFRDEQRKALHLIPHSGMVVSTDIGSRNDVHPANKKVVGERLARWALHKTYQQHIVSSGPLPREALYTAKKLIITFKDDSGLHTSDGQSLRGFSLDGVRDVEAFIRNNTVEIITDIKPDHVYYGWKSFTDANLVNASQLPASTFKIKVR